MTSNAPTAAEIFGGEARTPVETFGTPAATARISIATQIARLILDQSDAELWHDAATHEPYITVTMSGHREHYRLGARAAREYLARLGHERLGRVPGSQAVHDATAVLAGYARYDGPSHLVGVRLATHEGGLVLDLGDSSWQVVVVTPHGWRVASESPVRFRRAKGMLPLPAPVPSRSLDQLRGLLHIDSDRAWHQVAGWLVGTLAPRGPYPVLMLLGEQGSGKTTVGRLPRGLVDPHMTPLREINPVNRAAFLAGTAGADDKLRPRCRDAQDRVV